jgi:acetyl/propionyl-CoA carboxylase alpha subunit
MLAKVIASGETREQAIRRLDYALSQLQLMGIRNNVAFLRRIITHPEYVAGAIDTGFIERHPELLADDPRVPRLALIAAAIAKTGDASAYWRNNPYRPIRQQFKAADGKHEIALTPKGSGGYEVGVGETIEQVEVISMNDGDMALIVDGHRQKVSVVPGEGDSCWVHCAAGTFHLEWMSPIPAGRQAEETEGSLRAPMPGQVIRVHVTDGQAVAKGDILLVIEAMKMEHRIRAPYAGKVAAIYYAVGQSVQQGVKLLDLHASEVT